MISLPLSLLVVQPVSDGILDISVLPLFSTAAQENHETVSIFAEVNAEARSEIQRLFENAGAYALDVREITVAYSCYRCCNSCGHLSVQTIEPLRITTSTSIVEVLSDFDHVTW